MDLDTEAAPEAGPSRRESIEAAFSAAEAPEPAVEAVPVEAEPAAPVADEPDTRTAAERARDDAGRFAKGPKVTVKPKLGTPATAAPKGAQPVKPGAVAPKPAVTTPTPAPAPGETSVALKAPSSWKPAARERWAALPPEAQQEVVRRERETQAALQESSEARKSWTSFQQAVAPYQAMFQAEGASPVQAAASLFQTAAALRTAPAPHKAQIVADIVRTYGIDIGLLDQALTSQPQRAPQGQPQSPGQYQDPRVDRLLQQLENGQRQKQQAAAQQYAQEVEDFGAKMEFFGDVRQDMADLLDLSARRGKTLTLEQAYSQAVKLHPEISEVMSQREKAKAVTATLATTQRARAAASSVKSRPVGPAPTSAPSGRRGAIEAAFDAHER